MSHHLDTPLAAQTGQLRTAVPSGLTPAIAEDFRGPQFPFLRSA
jgi:hypothetical protein